MVRRRKPSVPSFALFKNLISWKAQADQATWVQKTAVIGGVLSAVASIVNVVVFCYLTMQSNKTAKFAAQAANASAQISELDWRPWITVKITTAGPVTYEPVWGLTMPLDFSLTNVGHSPAFHVAVTPPQPLPDNESVNNYQASVRRLCALSYPSSEPLVQSVTLFPGQTVDWNEEGASVQTSYFAVGLQPKDIKKFLSEQKGVQNVPLWFYGCVLYEDGSLPANEHHTGFVERVGEFVMSEGEQAQSMGLDLVPSTAAKKIILFSLPAPAN